MKKRQPLKFMHNSAENAAESCIGDFSDYQWRILQRRSDAKPFLKNNRTMVPLHFIAEAFGCYVSYRNNAVTIETKPLIIDGVTVKALHQEYYLTMGSVVNQINGNSYNEARYYIDLFQIHGPDPLTDWEETMRALDDLVHSGKVRYIGCSNLQGWQIMKANGVSRQLGLQAFHSDQSYYSLAGRDIEREVIPAVQDQNMGLIVWSPLAGGFLSGKYLLDSQGGPNDRRTKFDFPPVDKERGYEIVDALREIEESRGTTIPTIALAWLLQQPAVTSVIVGAKRPEQLKENLGASEISREFPVWDPATFIGDRYPAERRKRK
jgi:Predicted oxidoreductases (related to aryl-alcohol dehydrogenases)